ncbi:MAG: BNR repeat-containing protein [Chitinophagales bacterium]|nr:BNR repeat-containing protein [Chitinophagales bacterium]
MLKAPLIVFIGLLLSCLAIAQPSVPRHVQLVNAGLAWAGNSVNAVVFRKNALTSQHGIQFISYYDSSGFVVIGKRQLTDSNWALTRTQFKGKVTDAHRSISIALDGDGYLHMAWDHHGNQLRYCRSRSPYTADMGDETSMTGQNEKSVTYPEFYRLPDGRLLFFYRDGGSGRGNLLINKYDPVSKKWVRLQENLIDGEGKRNAYWQACVDTHGIIHVSWVWRESPDVASNHDLCYAVSKDGGQTWEKSTGEKYVVPVTQATAEIIAPVLQQAELINQTSMFADGKGAVYIAAYWKGKGNIPQYQLVYKAKGNWTTNDLAFRTKGFTLSGQGTKKIPVARPQVIGWSKGNRTYVGIVFRDEERGDQVSLATAKIKKKLKWRISDLPGGSTGNWEPSYDTDLWKKEQRLHLFVQPVIQADAEGVVKTAPTMVKVLQCIF